MQESEQRFSIEELAEQVGLSVRTIRYYIAEGLLPGPGARGKAAMYGEEHLLRLRLIRRLSEQHMPLAEMQIFLSRLSLAGMRSLLLEEEALRARKGEQSDQDTAAKEYIAGLLKNARLVPGEATRRNEPAAPPAQVPVPSPPSVPSPAGKAWQRWELAPGVELHIRSDAEYRERGLIERLFKAASQHP